MLDLGQGTSLLCLFLFRLDSASGLVEHTRFEALRVSTRILSSWCHGGIPGDFRAGEFGLTSNTVSGAGYGILLLPPVPRVRVVVARSRARSAASSFDFVCPIEDGFETMGAIGAAYWFMFLLRLPDCDVSSKLWIPLDFDGQ
jgi:hypothetical protein